MPLRPPGESLRLKIERLKDEYDETLAAMVIIAVASAVMAITTSAAARWMIGPTMFVVAAVGTAWCGRKMIKQARTLWDYRLGFMGERVVGEELNQLLASGFRVFHDVPFDGFNIDHVLVGPPGVYAVETKTRRKPADVRGSDKATVIFDGETLLYPKGYKDRRALEQARRNSRTLEEWLTKATGQRVDANAILTLPGWWVTRRAKSDVNVLNPDEIKYSFPSRQPPPLSTEQIQRIAHQLTERCRLPAEPKA